MCIFSGKVEDVSTTSIFVSNLGDDVHATVYEMEVKTSEPVAMLLPIPVKVGAGEDALEFVSLKHYKNFFKDMRSLFPERTNRSRGKGLPGVAAAGSLKVHDVGDYVASYVPSLNDFDRLDDQFRLPSNLWHSLPNYEGFGFAVFQLKPGLNKQKCHPMAFKYPAANSQELFFPTVHVHDRLVPADADYDHSLYYQRGNGFGKAGWEESTYDPDEGGMKINECRGLVRACDAIERLKLDGTLPNTDYVLVRPDQGGRLELQNRGVRPA